MLDGQGICTLLGRDTFALIETTNRAKSGFVCGRRGVAHFKSTENKHKVASIGFCLPNFFIMRQPEIKNMK
ncbi:hypothetical protein [Parageobacillus thermoglucosidasius]|uniref:hypothetical protein n=1 Tax=Parageobacillus thermoglucosidasius TaxID=1426 RepID=UPI0012FD410E|nr:hypothetical protein [Parageobacillus thermoglucosidasius]